MQLHQINQEGENLDSLQQNVQQMLHPTVCRLLATRIVNKLLSATQFQGNIMDSIEDCRARWTTYKNINRWFDESERQLKELCFAEMDNDFDISISEEQLKIIVNFNCQQKNQSCLWFWFQTGMGLHCCYEWKGRNEWQRIWETYLLKPYTIVSWRSWRCIQICDPQMWHGSWKNESQFVGKAPSKRVLHVPRSFQHHNCDLGKQSIVWFVQITLVCKPSTDDRK